MVGGSLPHGDGEMRQVYASREGRRKTERLMLELLGLQACSLFFFSPPNSERRRFRALRVRMITEEQTKKKQNPSPSTCDPGSEDDGSDASSPLQTTRPSASSVFLHNSIIRFFYVDASCSENMEFLKGPRTPPCTCQRSPAVAAAAAAVAAASRSPRCG